MSTKQTTKKAAKAQETSGRLERHPLSERFALPTTDEERLALATDMATNGQHQEILLYEGKVLDGWERYMGCMQKGITPKFKEYTGIDPAATAFGVNVIRRKLSTVQKAYFGAVYYKYVLETQGPKVTQAQIAKMVCVGLTKLNLMSQLLQSRHPAAAGHIETLGTDSEVTNAQWLAMLVECGIQEEKPKGKPSNLQIGGVDDMLIDDADAEADEHDHDAAVDDLTGGTIDDLLDEDDDMPLPKRAGGGGGEAGGSDNVVEISSRGGRIGHNHRSTETPASACAKNFKGLAEPERLDFVKFAWATLRPAIERAMHEGRIDWPNLGELVTEATSDPGKAALADAALALAGKPAKGPAKPTAAPAKPAKAPAKGKPPAKPAKAPTTKAPAKPARARKAA